MPSSYTRLLIIFEKTTDNLMSYVLVTVLFSMVEETNDAPFKYSNSPSILSAIFLSNFAASMQSG